MSSTNRGRLSYIEQVNCAQVPANPTMQILRFTSSDLAYTKQTTTSDELDSSGMTADVPEVGASSGGSINFEWSAGTYDDLIEAATRGTWSTGLSFTAPARIAAATRSLHAAGQFTNAVAGQRILVSGFTNGETYAGAGDSPNNGWYEIESVTGPDEVVLKDPAGKLTSEDTTAGTPRNVTVGGKCLTNGTQDRCFGLEEAFLDTNSFLMFLGQKVGTMAMSLQTGSIATGSFGFQGSDVKDEQLTGPGSPTWAAGATYTPAGNAPALNATSNVGQILIDGKVSTACFQSLDFSLTNNLREIPCIGNKFPRIEYGKQDITGSLQKAFVDLTLWRAMKDHKDISLSFGFISPDKQHGIHVFLPRVTLSSDQVDLSGGNNSDVTDSVDWTALRYTDAASGNSYHIQICVA
jgi:hypothetical protein